VCFLNCGCAYVWVLYCVYVFCDLWMFLWVLKCVGVFMCGCFVVCFCVLCSFVMCVCV